MLAGELHVSMFFFFFNDTATTEIYTLSLHDALPIFDRTETGGQGLPMQALEIRLGIERLQVARTAGHEEEDHRLRLRSEEHTSELQSRQYLVCRLLLEKKKKNQLIQFSNTLV